MFFDANLSARVKATLAGAAALGFLAMPGSVSAATLIQYNFNGNTGSERSETASVVSANITGLDFTRGGGLNALGGTSSFNSSGWGAYASNPNDFLTFGLSALSGYTATVNQLVFSSKSSNTGPRNMAVLAAVNGASSFQQIATFAQTNDNVFNRILDITPLTGVSDVIFRIVATNGVAANTGSTLASGGTFRVQNFAGTPASPFSINGDVFADAVAPVPEPATWAMMIVGFGLIGGTMRRRSTRVSYAV